MLSRVRISRTGQFFVYEVKHGICLSDFSEYGENLLTSHFIDVAREEIARCGVEVSRNADVLTWGRVPDAQAALFLWDGRGFIASKSSPDEWDVYMVGNPLGHKPRLTARVQQLPYPDLDSLYMRTIEEQARRKRRAREQRERRIK